MRAYSGWFAFVLLLGCVIGFAAGKFDRVADAQSVDNRTTRWIGASVTYSTAQDAFCLFDSQTNRLLAYGVGNGTRKLELLAVREISYDLKLASFGEQKPTVQEIKKSWEDEEKREKDKEKNDPPKDK